MPTLILSSRHSSDTQALWQSVIKRNDWKIHRAYRYQVPKDIEDPCVYGEMQFCDIIAKRLGLFLLEPPTDFLPRLCLADGNLTQRNVLLMHHQDLRHLKRRHFVKPANDKVFIAGVYETGAEVPHKYIDPMCPVIVSEVVNFEVEYRCYVLDGEVQTLSCYQWPGMIHQENQDESEAARSFAQTVLGVGKDYAPSAFVLDVGKLDNGKWAVIEANQAYASGIYHEADASKVLPIIARSASREVRESDLGFVRDI